VHNKGVFSPCVEINNLCLILFRACSNSVTAMKHILPIITITTLAAAASAQTAAAAPAGLSYNRATVSRQGQNNDLAVQHFLGNTNVLASLSTAGNGNGHASLGLGYVFKQVALSTDATVGVTTGTAGSNSAVTLNLRRSLKEVVAGLEVAVGYSYAQNAGATTGSKGVVTAELSYNINSTWSVAYGISNANPTFDRQNVLSVRHNF